MTSPWAFGAGLLSGVTPPAGEVNRPRMLTRAVTVPLGDARGMGLKQPSGLGTSVVADR